MNKKPGLSKKEKMNKKSELSKKVKPNKKLDLSKRKNECQEESSIKLCVKLSKFL